MTAEFFRRYIDIVREAEDDMFASRQHHQIAQVFDRLAKDQFQFAEEEREEDDDPEAGNGYENDGESDLEVAAAFRRGLQPGLKTWWYLDTLLQEDSADAVEAETDIDLYELRDKAHERWAKTPAGQAAAAEQARRQAEWEAEWEADAPARAANEVKMWVVKKGQTKPQLPEVEYDQREHPNFQKELAEFQRDAEVSWPDTPYEIKVTIGGKPVKV